MSIEDFPIFVVPFANMAQIQRLMMDILDKNDVYSLSLVGNA